MTRLSWVERTLYPVGVLALVLGACAPEETPPNGPSDQTLMAMSGCTEFPGGFGGDQEEELFGEVNAFPTAETMQLTQLGTGNPMPSVWINRLPECNSQSAGGHANSGADYGWYSPLDVNNHCGGADIERHREPEATFSLAEEEHCAGPGRYVLSVLGASTSVREVDFVKFQATFETSDPDGGPVETAYLDAIAPGLSGQHRDLIVNYETSAGTTLSPVIEFSPKLQAHLHSDRWSPISPVAGVYHMPRNFQLRVGAWKSGGLVDGGSGTLVRYFWNHPSDTTAAGRTGFHNVSLGGATPGHARVRQYTSTGTYVVRAHLIQPWNYPASSFSPMDVSYGTTAAFTVQVDPDLTAAVSAAPTTAAIGQSITFSASGSNGGGGNSYVWEFGDGTQQTTSAPSVSHSYAAGGTYPVKLTKSDQYGYRNRATTTVTVVAGPAGPPSGITASSVSSASATISWVNGDQTTGTTTFLEYRTGAGPWIAASGANGFTAGVSSHGLSGLTPSTPYSVRMWHRKNNLNSATTQADNLFTTASAPAIPPITAFWQSDCRRVFESSKWRLYFTLSWAPSAPAVNYQIGFASTNNSGSASIIRSGAASTGSSEVGPYLDTTYAQNRYFWVRFTDGTNTGPWFALQPNPLDVGGSCDL